MNEIEQEMMSVMLGEKPARSLAITAAENISFIKQNGDLVPRDRKIELLRLLSSNGLLSAITDNTNDCIINLNKIRTTNPAILQQMRDLIAVEIK